MRAVFAVFTFFIAIFLVVFSQAQYDEQRDLSSLENTALSRSTISSESCFVGIPQE